MSLPVAILAGGLATRLRPLTDEVPKSLVDVGGRPFAEHQLELLRASGIEDVVFCVGHLGAQIERALGNGGRFGMRLRYVDDGSRLMGTGGALRRAVPVLGDAFLVLYGDSYLRCDYRAIIDGFLRTEKLGLMTIYRNANNWERSNVKFDGARIVAYDKVVTDETFEYVDYGLGAFRAAALERYDADVPFDLADVCRDLVQEDQLAHFIVSERFYEIGSITGLTELRSLLSGNAS